MAEEYKIEETGTEKDDLCEGIITIKYAGLSYERRKHLYGRARSAVTTMKVSEGKKVVVGENSLKNLKNQKPAEEKKPKEIKSEGKQKSPLRGYFSVFLKGLACDPKHVVFQFRNRFPKRCDSDEDILKVWEKHHPFLSSQNSPDPVHSIPDQTISPGDKVKYKKSALAPVGTVEEIDKNKLKMMVRYGINDVKSVFCADYYIVAKKGDPAAR
jgi:hypothetical protein